MDLIDKKSLIINLVNWQMDQFAEVGHEKEFNLLDMIIRGVENEPTVEAKEVVHGEWMLEVEKEPNCHWSVKAQCSNCSYEKGEIWGGNFPDVPAYLALELSLIYAKEVKMSNFCPDCGADMRKKV